MNLLLLASILAAGVIAIRVLCLAGRMKGKSWSGHPVHFVALAASFAAMATGAVMAVIGWPPAVHMMLFGVAGWVLLDRRMAK